MYNFKVKQETFMMGLLFRSMVVKGTRDALLEKVKKSDLQIEETKILKIAEEIEIAMFGKIQRLLKMI